jgi:hypothetical protein
VSSGKPHLDAGIVPAQDALDTTAPVEPHGGVRYGRTMLSMAASPTPRERILGALHDLPTDATVDDAIERLVLLAKVEAGLAELDAGKAIPHEVLKGAMLLRHGQNRGR